MLKRLLFVALLGLSLAITSGVAFAQEDAPVDAQTVCRRIYGTDEWTRRCAPQRPDESRDAYCRRVFGTDEWTRRCLPDRAVDGFNLRAYCHRIYGTDEWTRRCLPDRTDWSDHTDQADGDHEAYCRRIYGTDEWTRRCVSDRTDWSDRTDQADGDHEAYCRRVFGTDEWTRRCSPDRDRSATDAVVDERTPARVTDAVRTATADVQTGQRDRRGNGRIHRDE